MRVLHIITRNVGGGAERNLGHHISWQCSRGHEVHVAVGSETNGATLGAGTLHLVASLRRTVSPARDAVATAHLTWLMRRLKFDVVHTHESKAGAVGRVAARISGAVVAHTVHMPSFGDGYSRCASIAFQAVERGLGRFTDVLIFVGEEARRLYAAAAVVPRGPTLTIPSPIPIESFAKARSATGAERAAARARFGLDQTRPVLAMIGALEPRKRHRLALAALTPRLAAREMQLVVAGDGPLRDELQQLVRRCGVSESVRFLGWTDHVPELLRCADCVVHTAQVEGVPQVLIQALAAGVPVVAAAATGVREVDAPSIVLVDHDARDLASTVESVLREPPPAVGLELLARWEPKAVECGLTRLDEALAALVAARSSPRRNLALRDASCG